MRQLVPGARKSRRSSHVPHRHRLQLPRSSVWRVEASPRGLLTCQPPVRPVKTLPPGACPPACRVPPENSQDYAGIYYHQLYLAAQASAAALRLGRGPGLGPRVDRSMAVCGQDRINVTQPWPRTTETRSSCSRRSSLWLGGSSRLRRLRRFRPRGPQRCHTPMPDGLHGGLESPRPAPPARASLCSLCPPPPIKAWSLPADARCWSVLPRASRGTTFVESFGDGAS